MIRIIAQTLDPAEELLKTPQRQQPAQIPQGMQGTNDIPLADDDPAELTPAGEAQLPAQPQQQQPQEFPPDEYEEIFPQDQPAQPEPEPEEPSPFPEDEFEEITEEQSELEKLNYSLSIPQKIDKSLAEGYPLRVIYTTLKGHTTERTIHPDYYRPARTTGNWVLIAWCELRQDWRGFIANRIRAAKLEPKA